MIICLPFTAQRSFLDPQLTNDGKPYAPLRYKKILQDCYVITRNTNIDYQSVMNMSVTEREYILSFIVEEAQKINARNEEVQRELEVHRQSRK